MRSVLLLAYHIHQQIAVILNGSLSAPESTIESAYYPLVARTLWAGSIYMSCWIYWLFLSFICYLTHGLHTLLSYPVPTTCPEVLYASFLPVISRLPVACPACHISCCVPERCSGLHQAWGSGHLLPAGSEVCREWPARQHQGTRLSHVLVRWWVQTRRTSSVEKCREIIYLEYFGSISTG